MGFFKDFKDDFSQAVNELMPGEDDLETTGTEDDLVVNTLEGEVDVESELSKLDGLLEQVTKHEASKQETAKFTLTYISQTICEMLRRIKREYGELPVVFSGGVASNSLLRQYVNNEFNAYFAQSEFSLDNAAGCAVYAYLKENRL